MKKIILIGALLVSFATNSFGNICNGTYKDIINIVEPLGWMVTSTTGGRHNKGSLHYQGKAVDVSCKIKTEFDFLLLKSTLEEQGYRVRDERIRPLGQAIWGGSHIHISVPPCTEDDINDPLDLVGLLIYEQRTIFYFRPSHRT